MAKLFKHSLLVGLLALAPFTAACERGADISGVTEPVPTVSAKPKLARVVRRSTQTVGGVQWSEWVTGGKTTTLKLGKYELFVPKGAVSKPTIFRMAVVNDSVIGVSLRAWDNQGNPVTQFKAPLRLTLPYDEAMLSGHDDPARLILANIVSPTDETILDLANAAPDLVNMTVTGNITHFSVWSLAISLTKELSPGID